MERSQSLWYFENLKLDDILCPNKIDHASNGFAHRKYKKGEFIYLPKNDAQKMYIINNGSVKIGMQSESGKEITKAILREGEVFGELMLIGEGKRRDFAQALEDISICEIEGSRINRLLIDRSDIRLFFMKLMGSRILKLEQRLESMVFKDSNSRIIDFLIELVAKRGERVGYEYVVRKFITHQEIANLTATSRQTVTTTLNNLRSNNIITFDRRRLLVRDLDLLKSKLHRNE